MRLTRICASALLGILTSLLFNLSECQHVTVHPDKGSTVTVSTTLPMEHCGVCTVSGTNDTQTDCHSSLTLAPDEDVTLLFNCSQPSHSAFNVQITTQIECTTDSCSPASGATQTDLFPEFSRTLTWDLTAPNNRVLGLDFPGDGLKEMTGSDSCQDGYHYTVNRTQPNKDVQTQAYCRAGPVSHLSLPSQATVSLRVPPGEVLDPVLFSVNVKPKPKKGRKMTVTADPKTVVTISRGPEGPDCKVCSRGEGPKPTCYPTELTLSNAQNTSLEFSCIHPQDVFSVEIKRKIECTTDTCSPTTGVAQPNLFPDFNRTLTWDLSVSEKTVLSLDFPGDGLQEITGSDKCQDGHQYIFNSTNMKGEVQTQTYCKNGPVSHLDLTSQSTVTLLVPQGAELDTAVFTVTAKPMVKQGRTMSVTPDPDTRVIISKESKGSMCQVCVGEGPEQSCKAEELRLTGARNTSVEFTCLRPQDVFSVEINRDIDCTEVACSGNIAQTESFLFPDFNRTFTWDLKVLPGRTFQLDFPEPGMKQIPNSDSCLDEHTYTIITYQRTGPATIGTYCLDGAITRIQVLYKGRVALRVPGDSKLDPLEFKVTLGQKTDMMAIIQVDLPRGVSDTDLVTANFPRDFPDEGKMKWDFVVPGMHNYTVTFLDSSEPQCLKNDVSVEYQQVGKKAPSKKTLRDPQPAHGQGNFNMSLLNCKTNRTVTGLTLNFRVSVMRSGHPVLCTVDLTDERKAMTLNIERRGSDPYCEIRKDSVVTEKITVLPGNKASLSFLDCPSEDLHMTASQTLACQSLASCPVSGTLLVIPPLDSCLPVPLHSFTWHLHIPRDATVDLQSPKGSLRQSLPGQECNDTVSLHVAEDDGASVGYFCPKGIISKVQVHSNVSITARVKDMRRTPKSFLNVTFSEEISESIIYTVNPKMGAPALLGTPNWPSGMKDFSTVSWVVMLPEHHQADLHFNISQPKCAQRHTGIKVQTLGSLEEMLSRREDEEAEDKLVVPESFYLNMSNCMPEERQFSVLTRITVQRKSKLLLSVILGAVGALLLLMLIVLAVVCVVIKKKKRNMIKEPSIYIGKGNIFLPGEGLFPKTRADNESHVYASIDETMVYGHLLQDSDGYGDTMQGHYQGPAVDSYRTFTGPVDGPPIITETGPDLELDQGPDGYRPYLDPSESFVPSRPRTPIDRQDSMGFEDRRMVDNELYTFRSTGDLNTIRLSAELEPEQDC